MKPPPAVVFRHSAAPRSITGELPAPRHVQPDHLLTPIHPDVTPDPSPAPPPTNTGLDYLALLRMEHDRLIQAQLEGIHFSQLTDRTPPEKSAAETRLDTPDQEASHDRPQ